MNLLRSKDIKWEDILVLAGHVNSSPLAILTTFRSPRKLKNEQPNLSPLILERFLGILGVAFQFYHSLGFHQVR